MRLAITIGLWMIILSPPALADQVLSVIGTVVLERGEQAYQIQQRSMLLAGDRIIIDESGAVSFVMDSGAFVYTASNTTILIGEDAMRVEAGEVRVITRPQQRFTVETLDGSVELTGGVQLIGASQSGSRFASQSGTAQLVWSGPQYAADPQSGVQQVGYATATQSAIIDPTQQINLANGQAYSVDPRSEAGWNVRVAQLQQQGLNNSISQQPAAINQNVPGGGSVNPLSANQSGQANQQPVRRDPTTDNTNNQQRGGAPNNQAGNQRRAPDVNSTQFGSGGISSVFTGFSSSAGLSASGGGQSDANQQTNQGRVVNAPADSLFPNGSPFPGNIHLITANTPYTLDGLQLTPAQLSSVVASANPNDRRYFSIGQGAVPTGQVSTDFATASNATPDAIKIPGFDNYVIQLEQYGIPELSGNPLVNPVGITGLLGSNPPAPTIVGATPVVDERAQINDRATFALGEFRLGRDGNNLEFSVRRSDQDRTIIKDNGGNDANDQVIPNPDVRFTDARDPRFLPTAPLVKVPVRDSVNLAGTRFSQLNDLRRAAATTVLADQLQDVSRATGQTRFVLDGRIVDISGYRPPTGN